MIVHFCPNPIVFQRLQAGPLSAHIDIFAQQLFDEGYAMWTAKYAMRLLADLTTWMQQQGLTISDLAEQPVNAFFKHRYRIRRPRRDDRAILDKLLANLRTAGVITAPVQVVGDFAHYSIVQEFQRYLVCQRHLAASTIHSYLDTVVQFLSQRFGTQPPILDTLCAQEVSGFMLRQALVNYLRDGRPSCSTRRMFVRLRAPQHGFVNGQAVSTIVHRALAQAGLNPALKGAHLLRHSLATRLLRNGASLAEIGELLRHRNLDTTQIYAKVDETVLSSLAPPWPGGEA